MRILKTTNDLYCFKAGMNKKVVNEIASVNCEKIQENLLKYNDIKADFAGNNIIAWSVSKVVDIFTELQYKCHYPFFKPMQITTESFDDYDNIDKSELLYGFTNFLPCKTNKNTDNETPAMSIIFNKDFPWENLDEISDIDYANNQTTTDHFLESFIHEFFHICHEGHLLTKYSTKSAISKLKGLANFDISNFQEKFGDLISNNICNYAKETPFDLVACDMSKRFIASLDDKLQIFRDPFEKSPYTTPYIFRKLLNKQKPLDDLIYNVYNGKKLQNF